MPAPAQTTSDVPEPAATADPIALAAFVSRRSGRVLAYLDAVTAPSRALDAAAEAFASYRLARAADPDAEAPATTLLRATRRAAAAHAENPFRPDDRERSATRTNACAAMPRLLVAWTESRLPGTDVARLVEHLQGCPDCRALRDAFDRAELGYRAGESTDPDATEVGVITTAMARAGGGPEPVAPLSRAEPASVPASPTRGTEDPDRAAAPEDSGAGPSSRPVGSSAAASSSSSTSFASSTAPSVRTSPSSSSSSPSSSASQPSSVPPRRRRTTIPAPPAASSRAVVAGATVAGSASSTSVGAASTGAGSGPDTSADEPAQEGAAPRAPATRRQLAGRRTEIPAPPARRRTAIPARPSRSGAGAAAAPADVDPTTSRPTRRTEPTDRDARSARDAPDAVAPVAGTREEGSGSRPSDRTSVPDRSRPAASGTPSRTSGAEPPEDPLGPEALGYAVPRTGLPRAPRRPAVPRVRRRRRRRAPSAAVAAAAGDLAPTNAAAERDAAPTTDAAHTTTDVAHTGTGTTAATDAATAATTGPGSGTTDDAAEPSRTKAEIVRERAATAAAEREAAAELRAQEREAAERDAETAGTPEDRDRDGADGTAPEPGGAGRASKDDRRSDGTPGNTEGRPSPAAGVVPATVTERTGVAGVGRRALDTPLVRQLGVPAVLLLVVLIGALIAAGAFAGRDDDSVAPVTRPTILTVPADPSEIPPLR